MRTAEDSLDARRSGTIAIVGRPNVGKSTLLNVLIGEKLSIVSRKAQTTRHRICGVLTDSESQFVFVDTPGFQTRHRNALNRAMNRGVTEALADVDVIIFVVEAGRFGKDDQAVAGLLPEGKPVLLVINKTDRVEDKSRVMKFVSEMAAVREWAAIVPLSAKLHRQVDALLTEVRSRLPQRGLIFPEDEFTDRSERFIAAEYLREKAFRLLGDELPYSLAVEIEKFEVEGRLRRIFAAIIVEKAGHKAIVIGEKGETIKRISTEARADMERLFDGPVYLEVWVKVKSGWADDERMLRSLGYQ
jgi:GTP-binding protein Era